MQPVKGHVQCMIHHDSVVLVPVPIDFLSCSVNTIVLREYHYALFGYLYVLLVVSVDIAFQYHLN